ELLVALDPLGRALHRRRHEPAVVDPPVSLPREEAGSLQDPQVPRDRGQRDGEWPRELADRRSGPPREMRHDRAARRVGQSAEGGIEVGRCETINHMVNYIAGRRPVKSAGKVVEGWLRDRRCPARRQCLRYGQVAKAVVAWMGAKGVPTGLS